VFIAPFAIGKNRVLENSLRHRTHAASKYVNFAIADKATTA
jgi:hypothetical protein